MCLLRPSGFLKPNLAFQGEPCLLGKNLWWSVTGWEQEGSLWSDTEMDSQSLSIWSSCTPCSWGLQGTFSWLPQFLPEIDTISVLHPPDEWAATHIFLGFYIAMWTFKNQLQLTAIRNCATSNDWISWNSYWGKKKSVLFKSPDNIKNKIFQIVYHGFRKHFLEIYY